MKALLELTAPHVSAFERNMKFLRLDAGLHNLEYINRLIDEHEKERADKGEFGVNGQA